MSAQRDRELVATYAAFIDRQRGDDDALRRPDLSWLLMCYLAGRVIDLRSSVDIAAHTRAAIEVHRRIWA